ncbi:MAG TPA: tetratricopeptide repeat protein [Clostridiaceae bacterium]|nr:tetratricopeptide repeat protein [Clostridiaceae bacterium]
MTYLSTEKIKNIDEYRSNPGFFFRAGLRYISKNKPLQALNFLAKAVEKEPYNADYLFNLACVYAELKNIKESNNILLNIIKNIDPTIAECYFGIACNYFDSGDFNKAREYFEKYIESDSFGEFANESYEVLYYLDVYGEGKRRVNRKKTTAKLINEGMTLVREGNYKKAYCKFDKAVEIDPMAIYQRNYLSLMCFLNGEIERAVSVSKSVLKVEFESPLAHFCLLMYYAYLNNSALIKKQLRIIYSLKAIKKRTFFSELKQFLSVISDNDIISDNLKQFLTTVLKSRDMEELGNLSLHDDIDDNVVRIKK